MPTLNPVFKKYHDIVVSYVSADTVKNGAKKIAEDATNEGLPEPLMKILKDVINEHYTKLKNGGK